MSLFEIKTDSREGERTGGRDGIGEEVGEGWGGAAAQEDKKPTRRTPGIINYKLYRMS